jgi:hypothetical protein
MTEINTRSDLIAAIRDANHLPTRSLTNCLSGRCSSLRFITTCAIPAWMGINAGWEECSQE